MDPIILNGTKVPYDSTFEELCKNLQTPGPLAWASVIAISHIGNSPAFQEITELSKSRDWRYRRSAIEAMIYFPNPEFEIQIIKKGFYDESHFVIKTACQAAAKLNLFLLHEEVLGLLNSKFPNLRKEAIATIKVLWQVGDFDVLYSIFIKDRIEEVRKEAAWALRKHVTQNEWRKLFDVWWIDEVDRHRKWACELALLFGVDGVKEEILKLANDKNGHIRRIANKALSTLKTQLPNGE